MTGTTWEAKAPRQLFERIASQLSAHGYDYTGAPGRSYGAETPCDAALALAIAANGNETGLAAFWARWMQCPEARVDLATLVHPKTAKQAPAKISFKLAAMAAHEYVFDRMTQRKMEREFRLSHHTLPKYRRAYDDTLHAIYRAESRLGAGLRAILAPDQ